MPQLFTSHARVSLKLEGSHAGKGSSQPVSHQLSLRLLLALNPLAIYKQKILPPWGIKMGQNQVIILNSQLVAEVKILRNWIIWGYFSVCSLLPSVTSCPVQSQPAGGPSIRGRVSLQHFSSQPSFPASDLTPSLHRSSCDALSSTLACSTQSVWLETT